MDFLAVEALVTDQHPRAEGAHCGELFHCETNSLRCCGEATIAASRWRERGIGDIENTDGA